MNARKNGRPLMISFIRTVAELRDLGLVAWGGLCVDPAGIQSRDMALRLGAPKPWLETLFELIARNLPEKLILVDPDFDLFMGDGEENGRLLTAWLRDREIELSILHTLPESASVPGPGGRAA